MVDGDGEEEKEDDGDDDDAADGDNDGTLRLVDVVDDGGKGFDDGGGCDSDRDGGFDDDDACMREAKWAVEIARSMLMKTTSSSSPITACNTSKPMQLALSWWCRWGDGWGRLVWRVFEG